MTTHQSNTGTMTGRPETNGKVPTMKKFTKGTPSQTA